MLAVVALFVTSCVQSDVDGTEVALGQKALVSLSVETSSASSRTIADGTKATNLKYAVYEENWNYLYAESATLVDLKATLELELLTGYKYHVVLWADANPGCYTVDFANKKVNVSYAGAVANDENRDAFYAVKDIEVKGTTNTSVKLTRPFAQINFGASDLAAAQTAGFNTANYTTNLTVTAYETLNFVDGSVEGKTTATFAAAAPQNETATLTAGGKNYAWISMNYVLCPNANASLDECTMVATDGSKTVTVSYPMAPARRNWKTNLVGSIFTDSTNIEVEVTPGTDGDNDAVVNMVPVTTAAELEAALANPEVGGVVLKNDITLNTTISRAEVEAEAGATIAKSFVLDGGGKTLIYTGAGRAIDIVSDVENETYKNVTIKDLTINCSASYCQRGINYNANGNLVLDNVKVGGENVTYALNFPGMSDNAKVEINNCEAAGCIALNVWGENMEINVNNSILTSVDTASHENYAAVSLNNDGKMIANGTVINIKGGKVIARDENGEPSFAVKNNSLTGEVNIDETTEVVGKIAQNVATVYFDGANESYGCLSLAEAVETYLENADADGIRLIRDVELDASLTIPAGRPVVLDLNGKTLSHSTTQTGNYQMILNDGNLTIKDSVGGGVITYTDLGNGGEYVSNTITNRGTLTVLGGHIKNESSSIVGTNGYPYAIDTSIWGPAEKVETNVYGGTVECQAYAAFRNRADSTEELVETNIYGGTIIGRIDHQMSSSKAGVLGTLNISGGTFNRGEGPTQAISIFGAGVNTDASGIVANITGGTFNAAITINRGQYVPLGKNFNEKFISGGTFSVKPEDTFLAEGYTFVEEDGKWVVASLTDLVTEVTDKTGTITVSSARDLLMLNELSAKWVELFTNGQGTEYSNYAPQNGGKGTGFYYKWGWTIKLDADIDLGGITLDTPISLTGWGYFDGQGHTIKNVNIVTATDVENEAGLFIANRPNVKNVTLDNVHVTGSFVGNSTAGILAGSCNAGVENITITNSSVKGGKYTGAVVGYGYTHVKNCNVTNCVVKGGYKLGGLIGYVCAGKDDSKNVDNNTLTNCTVNGADGQYAGGKDKYIVGKVVGNFNCNGSCVGNTITNMTTVATENIGQIEAGYTVQQ